MIITLCGSARFEDKFHIWNEALTLSGHTVFSLAIFPSTKGGRKDWYDEHQKMLLDAAHLDKIEKSNAIVVLNHEGYIGDSTRREIIWASRKDKRLYALQPQQLILEKGGFTGHVNNALDLTTLENLRAAGSPTLWKAIGGPANLVSRESPDVFQDEEALMKAFGQEVGKFNPQQIVLYLKLILEEFCETLQAANPTASGEIHQKLRALAYTLDRPDRGWLDLPHLSRVKMFDGLLDIIVVAINCGHSLGVPMAAGWQAVFKANMEKVDPVTGLVRRSDGTDGLPIGKVLKPDGWIAPDERLAALANNYDAE